MTVNEATQYLEEKGFDDYEVAATRCDELIKYVDACMIIDDDSSFMGEDEKLSLSKIRAMLAKCKQTFQHLYYPM